MLLEQRYCHGSRPVGSNTPMTTTADRLWTPGRDRRAGRAVIPWTAARKGMIYGGDPPLGLDLFQDGASARRVGPAFRIEALGHEPIEQAPGHDVGAGATSVHAREIGMSCGW